MPLSEAEVVENIVALDAALGKRDSLVERLNRVIRVYDSLGSYDHQARTMFNLFLVYDESGDKRASGELSRLLDLMNEHQVDHATEADVSLGILPTNLPRARLVGFRERIQNLRGFYEKAGDSARVGSSLMQLARIEQTLGNRTRARDYARLAEPYIDHIPVAPRIKAHTDLGFFLFDDKNPAVGLDHFWKAFDLVDATDTAGHINLLTAIGAYLPLTSGAVRDAQRAKLLVVSRSQGPKVSAAAKQLLTTLQR
jgi:hypothetical protein